MTNHLIPMVFYGLAVVALGLRLYTGNKREFIGAMALVVLGTVYSAITIAASVLTLFMVAVILSFIGDLLMAEWLKFTENRIVDGIIAFGFAHVFYIIAFNQLNIGEFSIKQDGWLLGLGLVVALVLFKLVADDSKYHIAVRVSNAVYALIMGGLFVIVLSFVFTATTPLVVKILSLLGVLLFMTSDSVLAYNEFKSEIPRAKDIIAVTYILAQIMLQLSPLLTYVLD